MKRSFIRVSTSLAVLGLGLLLTGAPAAVQAQDAGKTVQPVLNDKSITFGSRKLEMSSDGGFAFKDAKANVLLRNSASFWLIEGGKSIWNWQYKHLDKEESKFTRDGQKYIWALWYKAEDIPTSKILTQVLEVLPDGRISNTVTVEFPTLDKDRKFGFWVFGVRFPLDAWMGEKVQTETGLHDLNAEIKNLANKFVNDRSEWRFGADKPEKSLSVAIDRKGAKSMSLMYRGKPMNEFLLCLFRTGTKITNTVYYDFR